MIRFLKDRAARKKLNAEGYFTVDQLSEEEIKNELNDVLSDAAANFSAISACVQSHYTTIDQDTSEEMLEDAAALVREISATLKKTDGHFNMSYLYAALYLTYASNNALLLDEDWRTFHSLIKANIDIAAGKAYKPMTGYS